VNGSQTTIGLGNSATTPVSQTGAFVDGAAKNTFSGSWIDNGASVPVSATVFFTDPSGGISDVFSYTYGPSSGGDGFLSGFMISGMLTAADLAAVGMRQQRPPLKASSSSLVTRLSGRKSSVPPFRSLRPGR
jgi:hypothetical protein